MMMNRFIIFFALIILLLTSGCKKFLEQKSQDEFKPATVQELIQLMSAEGYPYQDKISILLNIMTDDAYCNGGQGQLNYVAAVRKGRSAFTWSKDMFQELLQDGLSTTNHVNSWQVLYKKIAGCNVVLDYLDRVSGEITPRENLRGQALAMRGFYYFQLVNMFAKPFNAKGNSPEKSPGVPLKLSMSVTDSLLSRNSVAEVYHQIETDLLQGAALMAAHQQSNGVYKMNELAAYALLSRVYLYEENWDKVIEYADKVISKKPGLSHLSSFKASGGYYTYNNPFINSNLNQIYDPAVSTEILWAYQINGSGGPAQGESEFFVKSIVPTINATYNTPYSVSPELLSLYETKPQSDTGVYLADLRSRLYFNRVAYFVGLTAFYKPYYGYMGGAGLRVAEVYLNRAEAKIRKAMAGGNNALITEALLDINFLRISRYDPRKPYVAINITDANLLFSFYKDERRRELSFDGHRWFDLRRYGMPAISHFYEEDPGTGSMVTLSAGDSRYTLQIPRIALELNPALTQNP
jgi:starch-binding outer membrane protein, SusD/RagB family